MIRRLLVLLSALIVITGPDDLLLDLKCLLQGESPMIAGQKTDALEFAEGEVSDDAEDSPLAEAERLQTARYINSRNTIIAARRVSGPVDPHQYRPADSLRVLPGLSLITKESE